MGEGIKVRGDGRGEGGGRGQLGGRLPLKKSHEEIS